MASSIDNIFQEKSKAIDDALLQINEKIEKFGVKHGQALFLDKDNKEISKGDAFSELNIPKGTAAIIANGPLTIKGDIKNISEDKDGNKILENISVFAKASVTANYTFSGSQILAGQDVDIKQTVVGEITAGRNFISKGTISGNVSVKGRLIADASSADSNIFAEKDVTIVGSTRGKVTAGGNFSSGIISGIIYGEVAAQGNVTADKIYGKVSGDNVTTNDTGLNPEINAEKNFITKNVVYGSVNAKGSITGIAIHPTAKIDTPHLYIREGSKKPENFEGGVTVVPKKQWKDFTPPQPEPKPENPGLLSHEATEALRSFRKNAGSECKDIGDSAPCPPTHSTTSTAIQR